MNNLAWVLFFASFGLLLYTYALYPILVVGLGFVRRQTSVTDPEARPMVTLIISAYNEETVIEEKLKNSLLLDYPKDRLEIVVASESTDRTHEIAGRYVAHGIRLRTFPGRSGKSATLYRVVPDVSGEIIVFSDANALYRPDAIRQIVKHFADPTVGSVIGTLHYCDPTDSVGGRGESLYWRYDLWLRRHLGRVRGMVPGINGSMFAIRRSLYLPFAEDRGDDYELCTRIAIRGHQVISEPAAIAIERASESTPQQFSRKKRLVRWNTMSSLLLLRDAFANKAWLVAFQVVSHRLLRYLAPLFLIAGFLASLWLAPSSTFCLGAVLLQVFFYGIAGLGWAAEAEGASLPRICLVPSYFLMVNSAALAGLVAALKAGQSTTWQKAR